MSRTVIDIDDKALARAQAELGTTSKVSTVNAALREIAARRDRAERVAAARYLFGDPDGIGDPDDFMASIRPKQHHAEGE